MSRIFINYRRQDSAGYVGWMYEHLRKHFHPTELFRDVSNIPAGADFPRVLREKVAGCDVFLAVIGPAWVSAADDDGQQRLFRVGDFVRQEIEMALANDKVVIPVLVGDAAMPDKNTLPDSLCPLATRNAAALRTFSFGEDVQRLADDIKRHLPQRGAVHQRDPAVVQEKTAALKALRLELVGATDSPLFKYRNENRHYPVLGEGNPDANILFIGESPGKSEAEQGKPFVGPSGDVLNEMLDAIGLARDDVFITNVLLDRPPDNRTPNKDEIAFYTPYVDRMIDIIQPQVLVTLGRWAMEYLLKKLDVPEKRGKISQQHGKLIKAALSYGEVYVMPMYHPAVVLYRASERDTLRKDFEKLTLFI